MEANLYLCGQVLDTIYVGPVPEGRHMFVFQADAPDHSKIPAKDIVGATVILVTCSYHGQVGNFLIYRYHKYMYKIYFTKDNVVPNEPICVQFLTLFLAGDFATYSRQGGGVFVPPPSKFETTDIQRQRTCL